LSDSDSVCINPERQKAVSKTRLSLIAAVAQNGVIGVDDRMPWRLSSDLKRFKSITMGKPVIMGRKTFETIGKPLAGRANIVVSRNTQFIHEGVIVTPSFEAALIKAKEKAQASVEEEIMVIGGGEIYRAAIDIADRLYITHVDAAPEGDTYFPRIDPATWRAVRTERTGEGPKDSAATTFVIYERIAPKRPNA
jgi:dihydrofolate reductase